MTEINVERLADAIGPEDLEYWADQIRHASDPAAVRLLLATVILARLASAETDLDDV